jgi:hypothetical protein
MVTYLAHRIAIQTGERPEEVEARLQKEAKEWVHKRNSEAQHATQDSIERGKKDGDEEDEEEEEDGFVLVRSRS